MVYSNSSVPIRILHMIGGLDAGGSQAFVMNLYRSIDRKRVQFDFILDHPKEVFYRDEVERMGGKVYTLPAFNGRNVFEVIAAWENFFNSHQEYKILHSHIRSYASIYFPIASRHGVKTIIHSHSVSNGTGLSALGKIILQYPLRYQADYLMACSDEAGEWLFGKKAIKTPKYKLIKNAIDTERYVFDKKKREEIRSELNIHPNEFVIGFIGRLSEPKNPLFAIEVFCEFKKLINSSKLLIVGDGVLKKNVIQSINSHGFGDSIIVTGARTDVEKCLSAIDAFIFPSLWEGLGISLIEAQASGVQCYCSDVIPKSAIVTNLVVALSLKMGATEWAKIIEANMGSSVRESHANEVARSGYDIHKVTSEIESFYEEVYRGIGEHRGMLNETGK